MRQLVLAIHTEGNTDDRFLSVIVQRTAENVLARSGIYPTDVLDPWVIDLSLPDTSQAEKILEAARYARGYHALIVHADADARTHHRALTERFQPGKDLVEAHMATAGTSVCERLIPLIPVRMTESWMLADPQTILEVIGTGVETSALSLPVARRVESVTEPKQTLRDVIRTAISNRRQRKRIRPGELFEPVARRMSLRLLNRVPSYKRFKCDLTVALRAIHLVP